MNEKLKVDSCNYCNGEGCEECTCEDCGNWLYVSEESKCQDCIDKER